MRDETRRSLLDVDPSRPIVFLSPDGPRVNRLQEVNVTVLPSQVCNQFYAGRIRSSMFCAGKDEGGVDACQVRRRPSRVSSKI